MVEANHHEGGRGGEGEGRGRGGNQRGRRVGEGEPQSHGEVEGIDLNVVSFKKKELPRHPNKAEEGSTAQRGGGEGGGRNHQKEEEIAATERAEGEVPLSFRVVLPPSSSFFGGAVFPPLSSWVVVLSSVCFGVERLGLLPLLVVLPSLPLFGVVLVPKKKTAPAQRAQGESTLPNGREGRQHHAKGEGKNGNTTQRRRRPSSTTQQKRGEETAPPEGGKERQHHTKGQGKTATPPKINSNTLPHLHFGCCCFHHEPPLGGRQFTYILMK